VRFLVEQDRVAAVLIERAGAGKGAAAVADAAAASEPALEPDRCTTPAVADAVATAAPKPGAVTTVPWCAGEGVGLTAVVAGDAVSVVAFAGPGDEHARKIGTIDAPGLVFAAPIAGEDDRDELAVVTEHTGTEARVVELMLYRWEGGRITRVADDDIYRLGASSARWIGARLDDIQLLIELESRGDAVLATGALLRRSGDEIRDVAPLVPVVVARHHRAAEAGEVDAGRPSSDDAHR
jgi:hypothetical protein